MVALAFLCLTFVAGNLAWVLNLSCGNFASQFGAEYKCDDPVVMLGKGAHGITYRVRSATDGQYYAVKAVRHDVNGATRPQVQAEIDLLKSMDHPNIIKLFKSKRGSLLTYSLLELGARGTVYRLMMNEPGLFDSTEWVLTFFGQVVSAVEYLHSKKQKVHADIKLVNVVVRKDYTPKLIDFDLAQPIGGPGKYLGTRSFMAPEVLAQAEFKWGPEQDVYSLGVFLYAMFHYGLRPFAGETREDILGEIEKHEIPMRAGLSLPIARLIAACLHLKPDRRPSTQSLIAQINSILVTPNEHLIDAGLLLNNRLPTGADFKSIEGSKPDLAKINKEWKAFYGEAPAMEEEEGSSLDSEMSVEPFLDEKDGMVQNQPGEVNYKFVAASKKLRTLSQDSAVAETQGADKPLLETVFDRATIIHSQILLFLVACGLMGVWAAARIRREKSRGLQSNANDLAAEMVPSPAVNLVSN